MAVILLAGSSYPRAFRVFLVAAELLLLCIAMGALLLPVGETSVTLSAPPLLYTDLQRIVEFYANCKEAKAAGAAPMYKGDPGYRPELDRDGDGSACDK